MMRWKTVTTWQWLALGVLVAGCSGMERGGNEGASALQIQALVPNTDVEQVEYRIQPVSCKDGTNLGEPIVQPRPIAEQAIPGNIQNLQDNPLDKNSQHQAADLFQLVPAGCYNVNVTPLDKANQPSQVCAPAWKNSVVVESGKTTEISLISQCKSQDAGAIDIIAAFNRAPVLSDVTFDKSKFLCGSSAQICAKATDPDNDPLELVLEAPTCAVTPVVSSVPGSQCWDVACQDFGQANMVAKVYDQLWRDGKLARIEDWLAAEGYGTPSHGQLDLFAYVDGIRMWPDRDQDGYGDAGAMARIFCPSDDHTGYSTDHSDCKDDDATVHPGAPEICDKQDNDCNGKVDDNPACVPPPGKDIVVFNDINPFDSQGMMSENNVLMVRNLVNYTTTGPRGTGTVVWMDYGRSSRCSGTGECSSGSMATMYQTIQDHGLSVQDIASSYGSFSAIPPEVKVIFLWNPLEGFAVSEINTFKQFAADGGRLVFVGEWDAYYGSGIAVENAFLLDMGASMTNTGQAIDCGYNDLPEASLRPHQITTDMHGVRVACSSVIVPGEGDYPLYFDMSNTQVISGVATISLTPIDELKSQPVPKSLAIDPSLRASGR